MARDSAAADVLRQLASGLEGEVSAEAPERETYSAAACLYEVRPSAVAWPRSESGVAALVAAARRAALPVTARGAGSGVAGHSVGEGIVADLSRHMTGILDVDAAGRRARVQPGVRLGALNVRLAPLGLKFAPDPSSERFCTIGGMIANNAGGAHSIRHGSTREHVLSVRGVTGAGTLFDTAAGAGTGEAAEAQRLAVGVRTACEGHEKAIAKHRMRTSRNSSGYDLYGALGGESRGGAPAADLNRLLVGSEGSLAIVTEATLALTQIPGATGTALAGFEDRHGAVEAILKATALGVSCAELVCEPLVTLMRAESALLRGAVPEPLHAFVLFECEGENEAAAAAGLERLRAAIGSPPGPARHIALVTDPAGRKALWGMRHEASPVLTRHGGARLNLRFIEDACVPPERLAGFLGELERLFAFEHIEAAVFGHAADSLVHVNPLVEPGADLTSLMERVAAAFTEIVAGAGGTLTGEHGDGRLRTPRLARMFGPVAPLFANVKRVFDPDGILNPGIKVPLSPAARMTDHMRFAPTPWRPPDEP